MKSMIDVETFIREMLQAESAVRYIAIVDTEYRVLASKQREGSPSYMREEETRDFASIVPEIIVEAVEKLTPFLGKVGGVTAHYEKALVIFYRFEQLIVLMSFEPKVNTPFYDEITETFRKLGTRYLTS
jgi:hypothetical protein